MFGQPGHLDLGERGQGGVVQLGREGPEDDGGEGSLEEGKGEKQTPEGWRFLTFPSFVEDKLNFVRESESCRNKREYGCYAL